MDRRCIVLALALPLVAGSCGSDSTSPSPYAPVTLPSPSPTPPPTLAFSDTFDRRELGPQWTSGSECEPAAGGPPCAQAFGNSIAVSGGRVRATENGNYIETRASFAGDIRVVFDLEKVGSAPYPCWDFFVELRGTLAAAGSILFDHQDRDAVRLGPGCADDVSAAAESPNSGRAELALSGGRMSFAFTNDRGERIDGGSRHVGSIPAARVRIWLAGFANSPRYLDNVRVFASRTTTSARGPDR